jgi:transcriptional regulator with XRE-family HTH domain
MTNRDIWLRDLRKALGLTQLEMATQMGLSLRPYQKLELRERRVGRRHVRLAESVALDVAVEKENPELAPEPVRNKAIKLAKLILTNNLRKKGSKFADIMLEHEGLSSRATGRR